jgi:hypothetical protein
MTAARRTKQVGSAVRRAVVTTEFVSEASAPGSPRRRIGTSNEKAAGGPAVHPLIEV